ncbi:unnamed protein product [Porites lobata]|uniref:Exportin-T n=1 Tax=Porites lobata TaxID=104759 RepID=A0ABN8QVP8_9CNID|nr:unnamed protein product [Porites lobata]
MGTPLFTFDIYQWMPNCNVVADDESVKFFCFQVLEHHIKTRHVSSNLVDQQALREILLTWLRNQCCTESDNKNFLKNKAAQVFSLIFVCDYPEKWPLFFSDLLQCLQYGALAVDMYLRILKAIDEEVVDRDVIRSQQEAERNTKIKDHIRDTCVTELVDSWFQILVGGNLVFWFNNEVEVLLTVFFITFCVQKTYENNLPEDFEFIYQLCLIFQYVFLTDTICTNKCNVNNALFKEVRSG